MINPLERRPLGSTKLTLSRLGVGGGSSFGRAGDSGVELLDACWEAGLRYFDTAPFYGAGESERRYGQALSRRPRSEFVLSTKVGRNGAREFDYSAQGVRQSLLRSLERLGLSRIDAVMIHDVDPDLQGDQFERRLDEALTGAYSTLNDLRDQGVIGAIGIGLKNWDVALRMARAARLDCIMLAGGYTLLQHGALAELLPWCTANDVPVILAAPYNTGILATGAIEGARYYYQPAPPEIVERTRKLQIVCARHAVPLAAAALQFPFLHPAVTSVVVGHEKADEVAQNLALLRHAVPIALWAELKEQGLIPEEAPVPT